MGAESRGQEPMDTADEMTQESRPPIKSVASPAVETRKASTPKETATLSTAEGHQEDKPMAGTMGKKKEGKTLTQSCVRYSTRARDPTTMDDIMETEELSVFHDPSPRGELAAAVSKATLVDHARPRKGDDETLPLTDPSEQVKEKKSSPPLTPKPVAPPATASTSETSESSFWASCNRDVRLDPEWQAMMARKQSEIETAHKEAAPQATRSEATVKAVVKEKKNKYQQNENLKAGKQWVMTIKLFVT